MREEVLAEAIENELLTSILPVLLPSSLDGETSMTVLTMLSVNSAVRCLKNYFI